MNVMIIKTLFNIGYAYSLGEVYEIEKGIAEKFITWGYAVEVPKNIELLPVDFPYRFEFISFGLCSTSQLERLPADHRLYSNASSYGTKFPLTRKLLTDYRNKQASNKKKNRDNIY